MSKSQLIELEKVFLDGDKIPHHLMILLAEGKSMDELTSFIDTLEGKFNGQQLKFKKPYVVVKDPSRSVYALWTTNVGN